MCSELVITYGEYSQFLVISTSLKFEIMKSAYDRIPDID